MVRVGAGAVSECACVSFTSLLLDQYSRRSDVGCITIIDHKTKMHGP